MRRPDRPAKKPGALSQQPDLRRFKGFEFRASDKLERKGLAEALNYIRDGDTLAADLAMQAGSRLGLDHRVGHSRDSHSGQSLSISHPITRKIHI